MWKKKSNTAGLNHWRIRTTNSPKKRERDKTHCPFILPETINKCIFQYPLQTFTSTALTRGERESAKERKGESTAWTCNVNCCWNTRDLTKRKRSGTDKSIHRTNSRVSLITLAHLWGWRRLVPKRTAFRVHLFLMSFTLTTCQNLKIVFLENKKKGENAVDERGISFFPNRDQNSH